MKVILSQPRELIANYVAYRVGLPPDSWHEYNTLGLATKEALVAGVVYSHWSPNTVMVTIGADTTKRWMTPEFLFAIFDFPFNQVGVRRLNALVSEDNVTSQAFVENLGFVREGLIRKAFEEKSGVLYGMLKEECKFISPPFQDAIQRRFLRRCPAVNQLAV